METQAKAFWTWFEEHNRPFLFLSEMDEATKSKHLTELVDHLHEYSQNLYFEIGGIPDADQELIITAEGNAQYFEEVKELIAAAPKLDNWRFIAFVPPRGSAFEISFDGCTIKAADIHFLPMENPIHPEALGLKIVMPENEKLHDQDWVRPAVFKILESLLGEESFALDIQFVDLTPLPDAVKGAVMLPLEQLQAFIAWRRAQQEKMVLLN